MSLANNLEKLLKENSTRITLQAKQSAKSEIWKTFREILLDGTLQEYMCACNRCKKKLSCKPSAGTSHLQRHVASCALLRAQGQLTLQQSIAAPRGLSVKERNDVKRAEVAFCVRGYHSINSVGSDGLRKQLQT